MMFGLGQNSTQTTLASVETISTQNTLSIGRPGSPDGPRPCCNDENDLESSNSLSNTPRDRDSLQETNLLSENGLSDLAAPQLRSTALPNSDSTLLDRAASSLRDNLDSTGSTPVHELQNDNRQVQESTSRQQLGPKTRVKRLFVDLKHLLFKRSRRPDRPESRGKATDVRNTEGSAIVTESPRIRDSPQLEAPQVLAPSPSSKRTAGSDEGVSAPTPAGPDETTFSDEYGFQAKKERVRVKRREATLRKRQLMARKCYCNENCHCFRNAGRATPASHGSVHTSIVPQHHLGDLLSRDREPSSTASQAPLRPHSPERHVVFAGVHLDPQPQPASGSGSLLSVDDHIRRRPSGISSSTRTSQATTAIDSRSSEARAASLSSRRAMSLPGLHEFVRVVENSRPALLEVLRNYDRLDHQNLNSFRSTADDIPDQRDSENASALTSYSQDQVNIEIPPRASATSLSHLPDPGDAQTEDSASALPPSSPTTGQGSNVRTPRSPHAAGVPSPPPQAEPDEVSLALQALSEEEGRPSTEVTDFGVAN